MATEEHDQVAVPTITNISIIITIITIIIMITIINNVILVTIIFINIINVALILACPRPARVLD